MSYIDIRCFHHVTIYLYMLQKWFQIQQHLIVIDQKMKTTNEQKIHFAWENSTLLFSLLITFQVPLLVRFPSNPYFICQFPTLFTPNCFSTLRYHELLSAQCANNRVGRFLELPVTNIFHLFLQVCSKNFISLCLFIFNLLLFISFFFKNCFHIYFQGF